MQIGITYQNNDIFEVKKHVRLLPFFYLINC